MATPITNVETQYFHFKGIQGSQKIKRKKGFCIFGCIRPIKKPERVRLQEKYGKIDDYQAKTGLFFIISCTFLQIC